VHLFKIGFLAFVVFLSGCDELSYKLAHKGLPSPSMSGWFGDAFTRLRMCNQAPSRELYVGGEKRWCNSMSGLQYDMQEYSGSKVNADVYGSCRSRNRTLIAKCEIRSGQASITQLFEGSYAEISKLCKQQLGKSRLDDNRIAIRFVALDYGFEAKDKAKTDRYVIEFAVDWGIFDAERPGVKFNKYLILGHEYERLICTVENKQVVDVKRSELNNLPSYQKAELSYYDFYK